MLVLCIGVDGNEKSHLPTADALDGETMQSKGYLVSFEGGDRCGKTTQIDKVYEYLSSENISAVRIKHPNRNDTTGKLIDSFLKKTISIPNESVTLLLTANLWDN